MDASAQREPLSANQAMKARRPAIIAIHPSPTAASDPRRHFMIRTKRVYDRTESGDGRRFLVERLWPRGMKKESLVADAWLKEVAPSSELRKWFDHRVERWPEFQRRYRDELEANPTAWAP